MSERGCRGGGVVDCGNRFQEEGRGERGVYANVIKRKKTKKSLKKVLTKGGRSDIMTKLSRETARIGP